MKYCLKVETITILNLKITSQFNGKWEKSRSIILSLLPYMTQSHMLSMVRIMTYWKKNGKLLRYELKIFYESKKKKSTILISKKYYRKDIKMRTIQLQEAEGCLVVVYCTNWSLITILHMYTTCLMIK